MLRLTVVAALMLVGGCGRAFFEEQADAAPSDGPSDGPEQTKGPAPTHHYRLVSSFGDVVGGAELVPLGGTHSVGLGYEFEVNQGLKLVGMPEGAYTVDIRFVFYDISTCSEKYCKILDFNDLSLDEGLYTYDTKLRFVTLPGDAPLFVESPEVFRSGVETTVTLTRDAGGTTVVYVNRSPQLSFIDTGGKALFSPGRVAHFAVDDRYTSQREASNGSILELIIWDVVLTDTEIAEL